MYEAGPTLDSLMRFWISRFIRQIRLVAYKMSRLMIRLVDLRGRLDSLQIRLVDARSRLEWEKVSGARGSYETPLRHSYETLA